MYFKLNVTFLPNFFFAIEKKTEQKGIFWLGWFELRYISPSEQSHFILSYISFLSWVIAVIAKRVCVPSRDENVRIYLRTVAIYVHSLFQGVQRFIIGRIILIINKMCCALVSSKGLSQCVKLRRGVPPPKLRPWSVYVTWHAHESYNRAARQAFR